MDFTPVDEIARAILYEGYLLYPYRTSSLKNCRPCAFGSLYPRAYCQANGDIEPSSMQIECLVRGDDGATLHGTIRFLDKNGTEREVVLSDCALRELSGRPLRTAFSFSGEESTPLQGVADVSLECMSASVSKVRLRIENESANSADHVMLSTHAILGVSGGRFLSLIDPPDDARSFAEACQNRGAWPVLAGDRARRNQILAAPIILYDFPQIAPQSPGNFFDGTEIDEMLTLRILTLTDAEKDAMRRETQSRLLLERTEGLANDQLLALHGSCCHAVVAQPGDRVVIRPQGKADALDLVFVGKSATVVSIEQDFEGRVYYTVALDDDPGQDLGMEGKPGHRFFFRGDELVLLREEA